MKNSENILLVKSPFLCSVSEGDKIVIWHSLFGLPKIISKETFIFLDVFKNPKTIKSIKGEYEVNGEAKKIINELTKSYFLVSQETDERKLLNEKMKAISSSFVDGGMINYLELIMSEVCNFNCTYCIHFRNLEGSKRIGMRKKFMTFAVATEAIKRYLNILRKHGKKIADINFGGGEPLLSWEVIKKVLEYCQKEYGQEFTFKFSLNTNASLMTSEIASTLKKFRVEVAASLDGLRKGNNVVRKTNSGEGTFNDILNGFNKLAGQRYPLEGIAMTINEQNFPFLNKRILDWAYQRKMSEVRIDIDVIGMVNVPIEEIAEKLIMLRRCAHEYGIKIAGFWSRPVENFNVSSLKDYVGFCGTAIGRSMCVNPSGEIYGCGYSKVKLGSLKNFSSFFRHNGFYHKMISSRLLGKMEACHGCIIEGQCGGGCSITREYAQNKKTAKIKRMCDFYRLMTKKLLCEQLLAIK